jgi:lipopolysaccharide/colanic/teichoic acid biosynthesis glycosyltransferase
VNGTMLEDTVSRQPELLTLSVDGMGLPLTKRLLDIFMSGLGLFLSAPLWVLASLAIKLEDGGPVLYRQMRIGEGSRFFYVLKFRSMVLDAERQSGPVWAEENDKRITRIGRVLRATALDELPQLVNIFKGDMSFVGPRPERPEFVHEFCQEIEGYDDRFQVRPGLTGLAQIYGQYDTPARDKLRYDLLYVKNQSIWLDLKLIGISFWITFRGKWQTREKKF